LHRVVCEVFRQRRIREKTGARLQIDFAQELPTIVVGENYTP
jgi:hypothetical protein